MFLCPVTHVHRTLPTQTSKCHTHLLSSSLRPGTIPVNCLAWNLENPNIWVWHLDAYMSKQYSTCMSLPCKLYFLTLDGRQSQVHSDTCPDCPLKLAVFCEVMPPHSVTEVCQHFSVIACLHYLPWSWRWQVLCNVSIPLPNHMASHVARHKSTSLGENITSGINTHLESRQAKLIVQVTELRAVFLHYRGIRGLWGTLYTAPGPSVTDCTLLKYITV